MRHALVDRDPRDRVEAAREAGAHGPGEVGRADQLLGDRGRLEERAVPLHVRLEGAARLEQRDQLPRPGRVVAIEREGGGVARRDDADRRRGPLEQQPEADELVRVAVRHRRVGSALEEVRAVAKLLEEGAWAARDGAPVRAADEQEQLVDRLPHLAGDLLPHRAGVLARERDAVDDGVRVAVVPEHPVAHVDRGRLVEVLRVPLLVPEQLDDLEPGLARDPRPACRGARGS